MMGTVNELDCDNCGEQHAPSCYADTLIPTPSGEDLFGPWQCHECGVEGIVSFVLPRFMAALIAEQNEMADARQEWEDLQNQRWRSQVGREVASFRKKLAAVNTVEDIHAWQ